MQVNSEYIVGHSLVQENIILDAVENLKKRAAPMYNSLVRKTRQNLEHDPDYYKHNHRGLSAKEDRMRAQLMQIFPVHVNEQRYRYDLTQFKIDTLPPNDPVTCLITQLSKRLLALGFNCPFADLRFEKGCVNGDVDWWHIDGDAFGRSATITFGSRPDWATMIVADFKSKPEESNLLLRSLPLPQPLIDKLNSFSLPAPHGVFINATKAPHRSPMDCDIPGGVGEDDYRLFIRFTEK